MIRFILALFACLLLPLQAQAFCGFFVSKAGADLFNEASKVVMSRADDRTVITMVNDFKGDVSEFAMVIPVPEVLQEGQINVTENRIIDHLDAYTAPRLVEYYDDNPCQPRLEMMRSMSAPTVMADASMQKSAGAMGVTIEASYTVGEYDILILSADESEGLFTWLNQEGYTLPDGAEPVLKSYLKQDMKFFVAKVNLEEQERLGQSFLRPIQVAFESPKFMLPIRLGTLNADGAQDLILMTLTRNGRVETANYPTVKIPSDMDIPLFVADDFADFYKAMFKTAAEKEKLKSTFLEYAWDMGWCDPCAADPLSNEDLRVLGAWWVDAPQNRPGRGGRIMPIPGGQGQNAFVTRLHLRYTAATFPEDLMLHETSDKQNFQGRYVMRHPFTGDAQCDAAEQYYANLATRFEKEAQTLSRLTGWDVADIRTRMEANGQSFSGKPTPDTRQWWEKLWQ